MRSPRRFSYRRDGSVATIPGGVVIGYLTRTRRGFWIEPLGQVAREVFVSRETAAGLMLAEFREHSTTQPEKEPMPPTTVPTGPAVYLSRPELAARIGVAPDSVGKYKLPEPDVLVGGRPGWLPETVDAWNVARPGRGNWRHTEDAGVSHG